MSVELFKDLVLSLATAVFSGLGLQAMGLPGNAPLYFSVAILCFTLTNSIWFDSRSFGGGE